MNETKILLEKNRSEESSNITENIGVSLENKVRMLESDKLQDNLSLYGLYNKERDNCEKFRFNFTINPVCSNVLFNMKTEVLYKEGSPECSAITKSRTIKKPTKAINTTERVNDIQAIRDTEYSHPELGGLIYHCGLDIFNNHMIRNDAFTHVGYFVSTDGRGSIFNTYKDYLVDKDGKIVKENIYEPGEKNKIERHLYTADSLLSFKNAFLNKCKEQNGWFGFLNSSNINIENVNVDGEKISINRVLMNNKPCEFIDLYPDRSLYTFVPKYNKYKNTTEKNWDYTIVYPYASDEKKLDEVCGGKDGAIAFKYKRVKGKNKDLLECFSYFKHNMKTGDYVKLYYRTTGGDFKEAIKIRVESVGDRSGQHRDRVFNVDYLSVKKILGNSGIKKDVFYYKRLSNGCECSYYFRKFKSLEVDKNLASEINKVAFGRNIYDDEIAQIIYTDDINLSGLVDNNGRPVSEVYLTILKRNSGYKNWYGNGASRDYGFSHCFGKVTSALDFSGMGINNEPVDYNIHRINNVTSQFSNPIKKLILTPGDTTVYLNILNTWKAWGDSILKNGNIYPLRVLGGRGTEDVVSPKTIEDDITIESTKEFYGDIVEFDPYYSRETVIGKVYHRFNTTQRESFSPDLRDILEDTIIMDDFDAPIYDEGSSEPTLKSGFKTETYCLNSITSSTHKYGTDANNLLYGNICPEGYYYNPFYKIKVREEMPNEDSALAKIIKYADGYAYCLNIETDDIVKEIIVYPPVMQKSFIIGQTLALYDRYTKQTAIGYITEIYKDEGYIKASYFVDDIKRASRLEELNEFDSGFSSDESGAQRRYELYWSETVVPKYAKVNERLSALIWRDLVLPSELGNDSELYDTPFMNGRFYKSTNINFFLRRQDPFGDYGLSVPINGHCMNQVSTYVLNSEVKRFDPTPIEISLNNDDLCY